MPDWDDILGTPYYEERTHKDLRTFFASRNPRRWRRLMKDFLWLQNEMKKMKLNPEDARYLL